MAIPHVDLTGKTALITGATSGIGEAAALAMAGMGASLYLVCRSPQKGEKTLQTIKQQTGNERIQLLLGDLADLSQVRRIAEEFLNTGEPLHILLNNAGITNTQRRETVDGFEETFAVNHLAPFLLTNLLLPRIKESAPARIVNVASNAHHFVNGMRFDDLQSTKQYKTFKVYGQSKLGNMLFTLELAERLKNTGITVNAVHPGAVATGIGTQNGLMGKLIPLLLKPFFRSPMKGAESSIYACVSPELEGTSGKYYYNCKETAPKPWALDKAQASRLWRESEIMTRLVG